jgi:hypothetical protein
MVYSCAFGRAKVGAAFQVDRELGLADPLELNGKYSLLKELVAERIKKVGAFCDTA